jgi:small G protein signaling modulator 3
MSRSFSEDSTRAASAITRTVASINNFEKAQVKPLSQPFDNPATVVRSPEEWSEPEATQDLRQAASDTGSISSDRASIGDWMGTWWQKKPKGKQQITPFRTADFLSDINTTSGADVLPSTTSDNLSGEPPASPVRSRHRKTSSRSVFGALGFSMLNPTSSSSSRNRRSMSVANVPPISTDPETLLAYPKDPDIGGNTPSFTETSSVHGDTLSISQPPMSSTSHSSFTIPDIKQPQGMAIRAIVTATRVMTSDPASILVNHGQDASELISRLAYELVRNARDSGLDIRDDKRERRERARRDIPRQRQPPTRSTSAESRDKTLKSTRSVSDNSENLKSYSLRQGTMSFSALASPLIGSFLSQQPKPQKPSGDINRKPPPEALVITQPSQPSKPGSVPLESIFPTDSKPPTQFLARTYTPLTSRDFHFSLPVSDVLSAASNNESLLEGMTDRFGFIYEVSLYDLLLLLRAQHCENTAPACLTGIKVADRREDDNWPDADGATEQVEHSVEVIKDSCGHDCTNTGDTSSIHSANTRSTPLLLPGEDSTSHQSRPSSPNSSRGRIRSSTVTPTSGKKLRTKSSSSILAIDDDTPTHVCSDTIKRILVQLKQIHDQRQSIQRKEWDVFVNQRSKASRTTSGVVSKTLTSDSRAAAILGLGTSLDEEELSHSEGLVGFAQLGLSSNREDHREFDRLVRNGIPLAYRSKVWFECSGGLEMREPGLFAELLSEVDESSSVVREIEKDVGRTMPLNIFFGRTGVGVDKLRRVLRAYSR